MSEIGRGLTTLELKVPGAGLCQCWWVAVPQAGPACSSAGSTCSYHCLPEVGAVIKTLLNVDWSYREKQKSCVRDDSDKALTSSTVMLSALFRCFLAPSSTTGKSLLCSLNTHLAKSCLFTGICKRGERWSKKHFEVFWHPGLENLRRCFHYITVALLILFKVL